MPDSGARSQASARCYCVNDFSANLEFGAVGESAIARWLRLRGHSVLPAYEKTIETGKGPRIFTPDELLIAPDLFVFKTEGACWVEAKHKTAFSWHRKTQRWVTGIDRRHYRHYLRVDEETPWRVWLMFYHEGGQAKDSPENSPAGLFCNSIRYLSRHVNHESDNWERSGMVYWAVEQLKQLATIEQLLE